MELKELLKFIEEENKRILEHHGSPTKQQEILARNVKLGEEFGELCFQIMNYADSQRKGDRDHAEDKLEEEFADVIITTLLLAKSTGTDIIKALENKIKKIEKRYNPR